MLAYNNQYQILESLALTASYLCHDGQGESGKELEGKAPNVCDRIKCETECTKDAECKGFDFTTKNCGINTCRLYPMNTPRTNGGSEKRKYCKRTESKKWIKY